MRAVLRLTIRVLAVLYLAGIWLDGVGCDAPPEYLPVTVDYFLDVAALFPDAAKAASEYRAEAFLCSERKWQELDTRPYFPLDPDDKENRFQRAVGLFREDPVVMKGIDDYLARRHNERGKIDDGVPHDAWIGGVRLLVVRVALPPAGGIVKRYVRRSLVELAGERRHTLYQPPVAELTARCSAAPAPGSAP